MEKLWQKREIVCAGGRVWERFMYLLEAFLSASSLTAPNEKLSGERTSEQTFAKQISSYRRARRRKNHLLGKASATHARPTRHVTFFLPLFKRKYVSLNGFHLHIFACVEEVSSVGEEMFTFSFSEKHRRGVGSLLFGGVGILEEKDSLKLDVCCLPYTQAGAGVGARLYSVSEDARKNSRSTLSGNRVFLGKEKVAQYKIIFSFAKLTRKAQLN